jgi:hypothetical protein
MSRRRSSHTGFLGLIVLTATGAAGLHALGDVPGLVVDTSSPLTWISSADPVDTIGALLRWVGLGLAYWVLASTVLYYLAGLRNTTRRPRWLTVATLPPIRRFIDRALATSLAFSIAAAPFGPLDGAEAPPPEQVPVTFELASDGIPVPHVGAPSQEDKPTASQQAPFADETAQEDKQEPATVPPPPATVPRAGVFPSNSTSVAGDENSLRATTSYTVADGDNLWEIAAGHLATVLDRQPSAGEIGDYWRTVISVNRDTLRSSDPNLIYPGEIITLPGVELSG